ncbi:SurA N-terminal domain-containing protein [Luteolibacter arcticus]|uniref:SurA N-terminal domain-containing protein n=1 Tax=Luteolibacter arcticus TaxID=1581411 RepID=A0ABT3GDY2_9BACT|nr:SurA N-terminal domain-containing protein [Luteolibacter arcticus]MCW1921821.1 SurA N-terminal domain-containing protein [Luteolibacter arcticus]
MNSRIAWLALFSAAGLCPAQQPVAPPAAPSGPFEVNGIAARVNSTVITKSELNFRLAPIYAQLAAQFPRRGPEFDRQVMDAREKLLQEMIDREIIIYEFKQLEKKGANLPDHVVDKEVKRQIKSNFNNSEEKFDAELTRAGMSRDGYRKMTRNQLIVQAMRAEHFSDAPPPLPGEIQKEYNEVKDKLRDTSKDLITFNKIYLPRTDADNPLATPESQLVLAEKLAADIKGGADAAALAKQHSRDAFAADGGFQKDVPRTDLQPEFGAIIFAGKDGDVVGPLQDPAGFTIVKITKIAHGPYPPLGEVRDMIEERVRTKKNSATYEKWIKSKRKTAIIDIKI